MNIGFLEPEYLFLLAALPLLYFLYRSAKKISLSLRFLTLLLIILSLAGLSYSRYLERVNLIFLLDLSDSVGLKNRQMALAVIEDILREKKPGDRAGLVVFGAEASVDTAPGSNIAAFNITSEVASEATDIGGAIQLALAAFPERGIKRILLLSDGNENLGNALDMAANARALGVEINVLPLIPESSKQEVYLKEISAPESIKAGQSHEIRVIIGSSHDTQGSLTFIKDGRYAGEDEVKLEAGENELIYLNTFAESGLHKYSVLVQVAGDRVPENNRADIFIQVAGKPSLLYISPEKPVSEELVRALNNQSIHLEVGTKEKLPDSYSGLVKYDGIIFDNVPGFDFSFARMELIEGYIRDMGGGFLMIGGENSFGAGGYYKTPLERSLPVDMDATSSLNTPSLVLVMVVDKSGSMEGNTRGGETKLDLVKGAVFAAVELLNPFDQVGMLAFDSDFEWTVDLIEAGEREKIAGELRTLSPGGGTDLFKALGEAYRKITAIPSATRHIIVLSDGLTSEADFDSLVHSIAADQITLSTVAVGEDADLKLLRRMAELGGGRGYFTDSAENIPRIFTTETMLVSRGLVIEEDFLPALRSRSEIISGIDLLTLPVLRGFVRTYLKPRAQEILSAIGGNPLLAVWRYGLGRSAAFTSDLRGKWGAQWLDWPHYSRFAAQLVRWLERGEAPGRIYTDIVLTGGQGLLQVDALDEELKFLNFLELEARVVRPGGEIEDIRLQQRGPGRYESYFRITGSGDYFITIFDGGAGQEISTKTLGLALSYSPEYIDFKVNLPLLTSVSERSGGRVYESKRDFFKLFEVKGKKGRYFDSIRLLLLFCALALFLLDLVLRKLSPIPGFRRFFRERFPGKAAGSGKKPKHIGPGLEEIEEIMAEKRREEIERIKSKISTRYTDGSFDSDFAARLYLARLKKRK